MNNMENPVVKVEHLSHRYSVQWAIRDINFEIYEKGILGLLGSNGAGKSTTMNIMCGVLNQTEGEVYINGINFREDPIAAKMNIGFLPQKPPLYTDLTVEEYLAYCADLRSVAPKKIRSSVDYAMEKCGITHFRKRLLKHLSGGYQQRVGIAQAILGDPPFLIFDEPTVGLDPEERIHFRNLFSHAAQNRLVLLSTHIIEDVQSICNQLVVINRGQILFTGTPEQLIQSASGHVGVFYEQETNQEEGLHITARVNTSRGIRCRAVADVLPAYVKPEEPSLEDAYLYLISREAVQ